MADPIVSVEVFQDHCQKQTDDFKTLDKKLDLNSDDNKKVHIEIAGIKRTLDSWTPFIQNYEKEMKRANAYKIVSDDLKSKGVSWKFWLGVIAVALTVISGIFYLIDRFGGR